MAFLRNVTAGRGIPDERLAKVAEHYFLFGGVSPINADNRLLVEQVERELAARNLDIPVYFGNRNWAPYVADTVAQMLADGITSAAVFVTSAFGSYSGCRQYREDLSTAAAAAPGLVTTKIRLFFDHPLFIQIMTDSVRAACGRAGGDPLVAFSAHSIPQSMADGAPYVAQLQAAAGWVAQGLGLSQWRICYQSRSGPPTIPWLEPDVGQLVAEAAQKGRPLVVCPIGFVSDHMEVIFDLDTELAAACAESGVKLERATTAAGDSRYPVLVADLLAETLDPSRDRPSLSPEGAWPDGCPIGCCPPPTRFPRSATAR